jgi:predicted RNA binding protein YcfA (HicA-like mRNA interferase family)
MVKAVRYRDMAKALTMVGCTAKPGKGDHEKWFCPCGRHMTVITKPGTVSPGLVRQAVQRLSCLPEGWLS